jgi:hypothetical protein
MLLCTELFTSALYYCDLCISLKCTGVLWRFVVLSCVLHTWPLTHLGPSHCQPTSLILRKHKRKLMTSPCYLYVDPSMSVHLLSLSIFVRRLIVITLLSVSVHLPVNPFNFVRRLLRSPCFLCVYPLRIFFVFYSVRVLSKVGKGSVLRTSYSAFVILYNMTRSSGIG